MFGFRVSGRFGFVGREGVRRRDGTPPFPRPSLSRGLSISLRACSPRSPLALRICCTLATLGSRHAAVASGGVRSRGRGGGRAAAVSICRRRLPDEHGVQVGCVEGTRPHHAGVCMDNFRRSNGEERQAAEEESGVWPRRTPGRTAAPSRARRYSAVGGWNGLPEVAQGGLRERHGGGEAEGHRVPREAARRRGWRCLGGRAGCPGARGIACTSKKGAGTVATSNKNNTRAARTATKEKSPKQESANESATEQAPRKAAVQYGSTGVRSRGRGGGRAAAVSCRRRLPDEHGVQVGCVEGTRPHHASVCMDNFRRSNGGERQAAEEESGVWPRRTPGRTAAPSRARRYSAVGGWNGLPGVAQGGLRERHGGGEADGHQIPREAARRSERRQLAGRAGGGKPS